MERRLRYLRPLLTRRRLLYWSREARERGGGKWRWIGGGGLLLGISVLSSRGGVGYCDFQVKGRMGFVCER